MKCEKCKVNEATTHIRREINGVKSEHHLCSECAKEFRHNNSFAASQDFGLGNIFSTFFGNKPGAYSEPEILKAPDVCPLCGMRYNEFVETGKLGCSECYDTFRGRLIRPLKQIHGACEHIGKVPVREGGQIKNDRKIKRLETELNAAVMKQEFEKAAELRDEIKQLKGEA